MDRFKKGLYSYSSVFLIVIIWQLISTSGLVSQRLFPPVDKVLVAIYEMVITFAMWESLGVTMYRLSIGFGLSVIIGVVIGILMARYAIFDTWMQPIFSLGYPLPRVALYPIFIFVFGIGSASKIVMIFLECLFPIVINTYYGMKRMNKLYVWSGQNMGASDNQLFWKVMLPATMPSIFTGMRIALPLAFVIAVLTEMIGATVGMGYLLSYMSASLQQDNVFAVIFFIAIVGFTLDRIMLYVRKRFVYWS